MGKKVLVVDDSLTARRIVVSCLQDYGYTVIEAEDGRKGLEMLRENTDTSLIFSDINMPWMTGLEMIEEIKEDEDLNQIPICLLTTESSSDAIAAAKKLGVDAYLVKPIQEDQLKVVVDGYIEQASH